MFIEVVNGNCSTMTTMTKGLLQNIYTPSKKPTVSLTPLTDSTSLIPGLRHRVISYSQNTGCNVSTSTLKTKFIGLKIWIQCTFYNTQKHTKIICDSKDLTIEDTVNSFLKRSKTNFEMY